MSYSVGKGKPPKHTQFKEGQSGNPEGGRRHDPVQRALKKLTNAQLLEIANLIVQGNAGQLKAIAKNPNATVVNAMVASVAGRIIAKGDMYALDVLLNRLIGKVRDTVELTGSSSGPQIVVYLPSNGREAPTVDLQEPN